MMSDETQGWHLDKRVPVALIVAMFLQLIGFVWSYAILTSKVDTNEKNIERTESSLNARIDRSDIIASQRYQDIAQSLRRIEDKIDRKADK